MHLKCVNKVTRKISGKHPLHRFNFFHLDPNMILLSTILPCFNHFLFVDSWGLKASRSVWSFVPGPCSWVKCRRTVSPGPLSARPSPSCYLTTWRSVERVRCWSSARNAPWKLTEPSACCTCTLTRSRIPKTAQSGPTFASIFCRSEVVERATGCLMYWHYDSCLRFVYIFFLPDAQGAPVF